jgi:uncharacterized BrkB/YihY/UPF0761 family membrane protein
VLCFGFAQPLTCRDLISRTTREFVADNGLGLAAQLAYYFFFALFPAILVGIALASFFPLENLLGQIVSMLGRQNLRHPASIPPRAPDGIGAECRGSRGSGGTGRGRATVA